jgi:hypothetical protein
MSAPEGVGEFDIGGALGGLGAQLCRLKGEDPTPGIGVFVLSVVSQSGVYIITGCLIM